MDRSFVVKNGIVVNNSLLVANADAQTVGINTSNADATFAVNGTANVSGNTNFGANVTIAANVFVAGSEFLGGNLTTGNSTVFTVVNATSFSGTANNSQFLNGQNSSYYVNAAHITGVFPTINASGNITHPNFTITGNGTANVISILASNVNIDTGLVYVDSVNSRIGIKTTTPDVELTVNGSANIGGILNVANNVIINGSVTINGSLSTSGNITYIGTTTANGDFLPFSNNFNLGSPTRKWNLYGNNITVDNTITIGANLTLNSAGFFIGGNTVYTFANSSYLEYTGLFSGLGPAIFKSGVTFGNSTVNTTINSVSFSTGNSTVNVSINSTSFNGTSNNALNLGGQSPAYYSGLSTTAYANAVAAAVAAYTNATTFAANASTINNGIIGAAYVSGAYANITSVGTLASLTVTANANFGSGKLFVDTVNSRVGINNAAPSTSLHITATDAVIFPIGNTGQRPAAANGMIRYNTDTPGFEGVANSAWGSIGGGGGYYKGNQGTIGVAINAGNLFRINANTLTTNVSFLAAENSMLAGPFVIQTGQFMTIATGSRVVIV